MTTDARPPEELPGGYAGKVLRIDLTAGKVSEEKIDDAFCHDRPDATDGFQFFPRAFHERIKIVKMSGQQGSHMFTDMSDTQGKQKTGKINRFAVFNGHYQIFG